MILFFVVDDDDAFVMLATTTWLSEAVKNRNAPTLPATNLRSISVRAAHGVKALFTSLVSESCADLARVIKTNPSFRLEGESGPVQSTMTNARIRNEGSQRKKMVG